MASPSQFRLAVAALALALAAVPAMPQTPRQQPTTKVERTAIGLPIVTSDGKAIGRVVATGTDSNNQPVLVGEIERQLGIAPEAVAIPTDLFVRKQGRIELTITEAEVNARLGQAGNQQ
jgi:hypothetical protein